MIGGLDWYTLKMMGMAAASIATLAISYYYARGESIVMNLSQ